MEASRELIKAPELKHEPIPVVTKKDIDEWLFGTGTKLTEQQKALFYKVAISCNLNPVKREVYAIPYGSNFNIITGYEVYLKRAERTGLLEYWEATVEKRDDEYVGLCTIKRRDRSRPTTIEAWFNEYNQGNNMWKTKPRTMIRKVAIAQAFRMVFSEELGGMPYTSDEMGAEPVTVISIEEATTKADQEDRSIGALAEFDRLVVSKKAGRSKHALEKFLTATAIANKVTEDALKIRAAQNFEAFWGAFESWNKKQAKPTSPEPQGETQTPEPEVSAGPEKDSITASTPPPRAITAETMEIIRAEMPDLDVFLEKEGVSALEELTEARGQQIVDLLNE